MASDITTTGTFTTTNMRPAGGEQIDALWGDNVADNTGYIYYRKQPLLSFWERVSTSIIEPSATYYVNHRQEYGTINGSFTVYGSGLGGGAATLFATFTLDGTFCGGSVIKMAGGAGGLHTGSFAISKAHLTQNTDYLFCSHATLNVAVGQIWNINVTAWAVT